MFDLRIEEKLDLFIDGGLRFYMKRVFWSDFKIKREIDAAGAMSELAKLDANIKEMPEVKKVHLPAGTEDNSYNSLVGRLNNFKSNVAVQTDEVWGKLEADVTSYFNKNVRMYEYISPALCKREGYYLDTEGSRLKYYDGKTLSDVGAFDCSDYAIQNTFATFFEPRGYELFGMKSRSMKLTPELYMNMIEHTQKSSGTNVKFYNHSKGKNPPTEFHVGRDFMGLFSALRERNKIKVLQKELTKGDERDRITLVKDLINTINNKVNVYLAEEDNKIKYPEKSNVMQAIREYLVDADADKFAKAVAKQDSWFQWLGKKFSRSDQVDRTLAMVREMQKSAFFQVALKEIKFEKEDQAAKEEREKEEQAAKEEREKEKEIQEIQKNILDKQLRAQEIAERFTFPDKIVNFEESKEKIDRTWEPYRVNREACLKMLNDLDAVLDSTDQSNFTEVILPSTIIEETPIDKAKDNVVNFIKAVIEQTRKEVDVSNRKNQDYKTDCAYVQEKIVEILNYHHLDISRVRIEPLEVREYNQLGENLYNVLEKTEMRPKEERKVMISADLVRKEIIRLQKLYADLRVHAQECSTAFSEIRQYDASNAIDSYLDKGYRKFQEELTTKLNEIANFQDIPFNSLKPLPGQQEQLVNVVNELTIIGSQIFDKISEVLREQVKVDDGGEIIRKNNDGNPRVYTATHVGRNQEKNEADKEKFVEITTKKVPNYLLKIVGESSFNKDNIVASYGSLSSSSLFKPAPEDNDHDHDFDESNKFGFGR